MKALWLLLGLTATSLQACPKPSDLATGIVFFEDSSDQGEQVFATLSDGLILQTSTYPDFDGYRNELAKGTYVSSIASLVNDAIDPNSVLVSNYPGGLQAVPEPSAGQRWRVNTTVTAIDETYDETQVASWQKETTITIGDCAFKAIPGTIRYSSKYGKTTEYLNYLPDFGFALLVGYQENTDPKDIYGFTHVQAVR